MSGRDLKGFVNYHRDAIGAADSSLVSSFLDGRGSQKYRQANYDKLKAIAQLRKATGEQSLKKVEKIAQASKNKKETNLLQQHKAVWQKEQIHLHALQTRLQSELEGLKYGGPWTESCLKEFYNDVDVYEAMLQEDFCCFKKSTVEPIWDLKDDLEFWLSENRQKLIFGAAAKEHEDVLQVVHSVHAQQNEILKHLQQEMYRVEAELDTPELKEVVGSDGTTHVECGIPEEAAELECPDEVLKHSVLEEFHLLDKKYQKQLEYLQLKYHTVPGSTTGGWSRDDHLHFQLLLDQYPKDLPNKRLLYIDRMLRELRSKTRAQIVEHESWLLAHRFYQEQRRSTLEAWVKDRQDMVQKVKATFAEAFELYEEEMEKAVNRLKQEQLCQQLYEKVLKYRAQREEAMHLQQAIAAQEAEEHQETIRAEEEKERKRREKISHKLKIHHDQKEQERIKIAEAEKRRLEELKKELAIQAKADQERIKYREELQEQKREAQKVANEKQLEIERIKERNLEMLREQVRVHVESDPERLLQPTEATQARAAAAYEEEEDLLKPLFTIHGYSQAQVGSDRRLTIEQALRQAGLHNTDYAREVISRVKPPSIPRRDTEATFFKKNNSGGT